MYLFVFAVCVYRDRDKVEWNYARMQLRMRENA